MVLLLFVSLRICLFIDCLGSGLWTVVLGSLFCLFLYFFRIRGLCFLFFPSFDFFFLLSDCRLVYLNQLIEVGIVL